MSKFDGLLTDKGWKQVELAMFALTRGLDTGVPEIELRAGAAVSEPAEPTPWVAVDLDGTLAQEGEWKGVGHIGRPLPAMVELVKRMLASGRRVKIFTARVGPYGANPEAAREHIQRWCQEHLGQVLEVTATKDRFMVELYDDLARPLPTDPDTGIGRG